MYKKLNKKGFTLIELIVVIAVIGILVLLAAPRFLGYTKDAHVIAMKADAKVLSNAALVYHIEAEQRNQESVWPVDMDGETQSVKFRVFGDEDSTFTVEGYLIEEGELDSTYIKNLKNPIGNYVLVIEDDEFTGEVFHVEPVTDKAGTPWIGVNYTYLPEAS